jgi:hypothetical protein
VTNSGITFAKSEKKTQIQSWHCCKKSCVSSWFLSAWLTRTKLIPDRTWASSEHSATRAASAADMKNYMCRKGLVYIYIRCSHALARLPTLVSDMRWKHQCSAKSCAHKSDSAPGQFLASGRQAIGVVSECQSARSSCTAWWRGRCYCCGWCHGAALNPQHVRQTRLPSMHLAS